MLNPSQVIDRIELKNFRGNGLDRLDLYVTVDDAPNVLYSIGDYLPETKQFQFYGARLTVTQINAIVQLVEQENSNE